ncbi:DNA-processing protein DprA [Novispirillum sp. DQ9]|uniref:DNA-processing protein DprA n=1 Tax=Novispirillum sp. DQ9 TaxID=3398612 RepID=UPI003C7977FE
MTTQPRLLSEAERIDWLRLIRSENVGPVTFFRLLERFGSAGEALRALPDLARHGGRTKPIKVCSKARAEAELEDAARQGMRAVCSGEPDFPTLLAATDGAPPLLYVKGHAGLFARPCMGMVGSRGASAGARQFARKMALDLGRAGVVVVSGMARGLDTAAHEGALETGTVAVLAGGADIIYPPENAGLYHRIAEMGAVVSEMPPGTEPQARHFPRRNRIISGMSAGVVVVEATARSGSLITARYAAEQGREVFAVPGSPVDARAAGPNGLIKDGAVLTQGAGDILEVLDDLLRRPFREPPGQGFDGPPPPLPDDSALSRARRAVLEALGPIPVTVDEIIRQCQLSPSVVSMILLELELAGRLERHPGHRVTLLPDV